jgi:hypothetical protein
MPRDLALPPVLLEQLRLPKHRYSNCAAAEPYRLARSVSRCPVALRCSSKAAAALALRSPIRRVNLGSG